MSEWTCWRTRFLLFTGKGGVGKTTIAATVAIALAGIGKRVLVVSTDPASNLQDVFGTAVHDQPTAVVGCRWSVRDEHRPGGRRGGVPPEGARATAKALYRTRSYAKCRGAAVGAVHRRDRCVRRVQRAARGSERDGGVRSCGVRHGTDRAHAAPAELARRVEPNTSRRPRRARAVWVRSQHSKRSEHCTKRASKRSATRPERRSCW